MSPESIARIKSDLRKKYRNARQSIAAEVRLENDRIICAQIAAFTAMKKASRITGYLAFDGEPDISAALGSMNSGSVEVHLPVITGNAADSAMIFRRWLPQSRDAGQDASLKRNSFGIEEPVIGAEIEPQSLDIIFLPLVAWDESGGRLGMGAGYYDKTLATVANDARPLRIGIAYEAQCAPELPMNENDVPLHGVITEEGLIDFNELLAVQERT